MVCLSAVPTPGEKQWLGSGFQIAMRDLDIRGAGNMLGGEQSGFMAEIGFEMYQKILNESIRELKRTEFKELFKEEISRFVLDSSRSRKVVFGFGYMVFLLERL